MPNDPLEDTTRLRDAAKLLLDDFQRRRAETERELARQELELQRNLAYYDMRLNRLRNSYAVHTGIKTADAHAIVAEHPERGMQANLRRIASEKGEEYGAVTHAVEEFAKLSTSLSIDTAAQYVVQLHIRPDIETAKKSVRSAVKGLLKRKFLRKTKKRGVFACNKRDESQDELRLIDAQRSQESEVSNR